MSGDAPSEPAPDRLGDLTDDRISLSRVALKLRR